MTNPWAAVYRHPACRGLLNKRLPFALYLDVEATNHCTMRCVFCVRRQMSRARGFMPLRRFERLCRSARKYGCRGIRLIRWGEPLLHPDISRLVSCAKDYGLLTHITTNGQLLDRRKARALIRAGLDSLIVSMQGTNAVEYARLRAGGSFACVQRNAQRVRAVREEMGARYPFVQINTTITDESVAEVARFRRLWRAYADAVAVGYTWFRRLKDIGGLDDLVQRARRLPRRFRCFETLYKMSVDWDGRVSACCQDYDRLMTIGHCDRDDLLVLWRSPERGRIQSYSSSGHLDKLVLCSSCELNYAFRGRQIR